MMTIRRFLIQRVLKPESVGEYIQYHQNVPAGLMQAYHEAGVTDLSCFVCSNKLIVYMEVDQDIYEKKSVDLTTNAIDVNWQALMATLNDPEAEIQIYDEVFRMTE
jgi:L-rhamnose mutarotase